MEAANFQFFPVKRDKVNLIISVAVFLTAFYTYLRTMAPTVSFWDCGEFIACSYILGIPHPPGTPLFVLIGRLFTLLPISGEIAVRVNFISVLTSAIAVWLAYILIVRVVKYWYGPVELNWNQRLVAYAGGASGALFLTFSSTFWFNAVEAEVYGISMMLMLIITFLAFLWAERRDKPGAGRYLVMMTYLAFLSIGIHMTIFLVMPVIFVLIIIIDRRKLADWRFWAAGASMLLVAFHLVPFLIAVAAMLVLSAVMAFAAARKDRVWRLVFAMMIMVVIGYSVQLFIPVRASLHPSINENDPDDWSSFTAFLERKQYGQESMITRMFTRRGTWSDQFGTHPHMGFWGFFREQYSSDKWRFVPFILGILGIWEALRRRWKMGVFLLLMFLVCSVGLVLYMNFSDGTLGERLEVRDRDYFFTPGFVYFALLIGIGASGFILWLIELFGDKIGHRLRLLITVVVGVVLVAFPLTDTRAFHWFSHDRTGNYIPWDYAYNILQSCDENAILFTNGDNDTFPLWFLQEVEKVRTDVRIVNLSLLNTPWYILQLKHEMGVPIRLTDEQIMKLSPIMTAERKFVRVQDIMVQEIITANNWKEPIYFAVTVSSDNRVGLTEHLRMEGMAFRIVPEKVSGAIQPEILAGKLWNVFQFRGLGDSSVYKDENDSRLVANYVSAFLQLSEYYKSEKKWDEAIKFAEKAIDINPSGWRAYAFLAQLYSEQDDFAKVKELVERAPEQEEERLYLNSAYAYTQAGRDDRATEVYKLILKDNPGSEMAFQFLFKLYYERKRYRESIELIDEYLKNADLEPKEYREIQQYRSELARLAARQSEDSTAGVN